MPSIHDGISSVKLGRLRFDLASKQLFNEKNERVYMRSQAEHVFRILVEHLGELVTRDHLFSEVWPDLNVTDDSLTQCIADIRRALDDTQRSVVQTVPKRGFILHSAQESPAQVSSVRHPALPRDSVTGFSEAQRPFEPAQAALLFAQGDGQQNLKSATAALVDRMSSQVPCRVVDQGTRGLTMIVENVPTALRGAIECAQADKLKIGIDVSGRSAVSAEGMAKIADAGQAVVSVDIKDAAFVDPGLDFEDLGDIALQKTGGSQRVFRAERSNPDHVIRPRVSATNVLPTIAVIAPRPLDSAAGSAIYGDLIADEVAMALSRSREINVISRLSCSPFQSGGASMREIREHLGVDFVLTGFFRKSADRIVLNIELSESASQMMLWSERLDLSEAELLNNFTAVEEIVQQIRKVIVLNEIRHVRSLPIESLGNYSLLLGAVGLMHRLSPSDFKWSQSLLETLIERAPHQPAPYAWLARWHVLKVMQGWSDSPDLEASRAMEYALRALDLDPENALALTNQGFVLTNLLRRLDDAEAAYDAAISNNPNDAHGLLLRGMLCAFQDRAAEGVRDTECALRLAPLDPHRFFFLALGGGANLAAGDYDRAIELLRASLRLNRTHASSQRMLLVAHVLAGDARAAEDALENLLELQPGLTVGAWLESSPSADFEVGRRFADALRTAGLPK